MKEFSDSLENARLSAKSASTKPKCSKEDIINAAYELMIESGVDSIVSREVGKKLGTTTAPIFTFFSGMNELKEEVYQKTLKECSYSGNSAR